MSNQWIRLYREALHDPKIVTLGDRQHRAWVNLLLIADDDGWLPPMRDIACHLRSTAAEAEQLVNDLIELELVDIADGPKRFRMHGWDKRQFRADSSTERVRKHRSKARNGDETLQKQDETVSVTPPESEPDTETDSEPVQTRERAKAGFDLKFGTGSEVPAVEPELIRRAEGLGLNSKAIEGECFAPHVKNPSAYFQSLCRKRLREMVPGISDDVIGRGLCGDLKAYGVLMDLILMADNVR